MKLKITNKKVKENYARIYNLNTCKSDRILSLFNAFGYTCGIYGWNADFYDIDGVCVCVGYRSLIGQMPTEEQKKKINKLAEKVDALRNDFTTDWKLKDKKYNKIKNDFIKILKN